MGYNTYITGGVIITPPIDPTKFDDLISPTGTNAWDTDKYFVHTKDVEGDEDVQLVNGQITVVGKTAGHSEVDYAYEESLKAYDFDEHVQKLVERAKSLGHVVNGSFDGDGEESEDFWRININDNVIQSESGTITYPSDRYSDLELRGRDPRAHGNVIPRPDGKRAKCGGQPYCPECKAEYDFLMKALYG